MKLSIVIPVFNEEKTIYPVLEKVSRADSLFFDKEIIVVDDCSSDNTRQEIGKFQKDNPHLIFKTASLEKNMGKGAALRKGFSLASGDLILIQDADLEYDPASYPLLLSSLKEGVGAVFGKRGNKLYSQRGLHYLLGAKLLTFFFNILFFANLSDLYTGYKLFYSRYLKEFNSNGFEIEAELAAKLAKQGAKIKEARIEYVPRSKEQGKKIKAKDALIGLLAILRYRFFD